MTLPSLGDTQQGKCELPIRSFEIFFFQLNTLERLNDLQLLLLKQILKPEQ